MVTHLQQRDRQRDVAPRLARTLVETYGVRRVILFGSLAWGGVDEQSDIDLAVEGLPADRLAEAHGALMLQASGPVDLVRLETLPATFRQRLEAEGEVLHVQPPG
jgi:predicted nucleotidyltransferase